MADRTPGNRPSPGSKPAAASDAAAPFGSEESLDEGVELKFRAEDDSPPQRGPSRAPASPAQATDEELDELELVPDDSTPPKRSAPQTQTLPTPTVTSPPVIAYRPFDPHGDTAPERDRIVVLGRRQSGKTIFLASIYHKLWKSVDGLSAKSLSGEIHKQLITTYQMLEQGHWPPSTLGTSQIDLELEYHGKKRLLVALDFAGELFSKAFVDEQTDWPGVKELVNHIDRAAAVILLVDPAVVAGVDSNAAMDDDFGLVQAVQRIRNWPGGDLVPVVLVLTKSDQNQPLVDRFGGALEFSRRHFRPLLRVLKELPVIQISAIQTTLDAVTKKRTPRRDSNAINLDGPLRYCLCALEKAEEVTQQQQAEHEQRMMVANSIRHRQMAAEQERRSVIRLSGMIAAVGTVLVALILIFRI